MDKRTKILLYAGGVFGLIALFIVMSIILPPPQQPKTAPQELKILTEEESQLPEAKPQEFFGELQQTGTLVVTTNVSGAWGLIDPPVEAYAEAPAKPIVAKQVPEQHPPFTITAIPAGKHRIVITHENYIAQHIDFDIQPGQVTRLDVTLSARP